MHMQGILLTVNQLDAQSGKKRNSPREGDFGSIRLEGEHGFSVEHPPDLYAVKAARQFQTTCFIGIETFKRMRMTQAVQLGISGLEFGNNPCAVLTGARKGGAMRNDGFKALVDRYPIGFVAQGFRQRTPDMQILRHDNGARVYGVPEKPTVFAEPRKNPLPIRRQQPSRIQIAADTDQTVALFQRVKWVGKSVIVGVKQGDTHRKS